MNELGVQSPVDFYDLLDFTLDADAKAFRRRRSMELKHGCISATARVSYMNPKFLGKWPGYLSPFLHSMVANIPNGLAAVSKVPAMVSPRSLRTLLREVRCRLR